ncbi:MAG: porin family protein [Bacteroidales bacterium]|nr:porin family protein [Bacteroidales bacterium]
MRTGEQIRARVTEISQTELRFRLFEQPTGPIRVQPLSEVFAITYEDGTREVINPLTPTNQPQTQPASGATQPVSQVQTTTRVRPTNIATQQNDWALEGSLLMAMDSEYTLFGIGARFLYNASNIVRLEGSFAYFFPRRIDAGFSGIEASVSMWDLNFNTHYLLPLSNTVVFYPLTGIGITGLTGRVSGFGQTERNGLNFFTLNIGVGMDFQISETVNFNIEPRYKIFTGREFDGLGMFFLRAGLAFRL